MAKQKPVIQSDLTLTEVQRQPPYARYFFSDYTGEDPQAGMDVRVRGFQHTGNNGQNVIGTITLPAPGWFEVPLTTQTDETDEAKAIAQFDTAQPCSVLTQPSKQINMKYGANNSGCTSGQRRKKLDTQQGTTAPAWNDPNGKTIGWINKRLHKTMAHYWKHDLTAGDRDAWNSAAIGNSWHNYKRHFTSPNGFQLFMAQNRFARSAAFSPGDEGAGLFRISELMNGYTFAFPVWPPSNPLEPLAAPTPTIIAFYDRVELFMSIAGAPDPYNLVLIAYTSQDLDSRGATPKPSYRDTYSFVNFNDPDFEASVILDYPNPPGTPAGNRTVGLRWWNYNDMTTSPITWLKV